MAPRILYIEDNVDNLILVRRILRAEGCEVLEATSATQGLQMAEDYEPDLILMDINMPEVDGLMAAASLRRHPRLKDIPIIAVTANVMRDVLRETLTSGCDGYIAKPIDVDSFPDQVFSYLRSRRQLP